MKSFRETFKDRIDGTDGTVVLDEKKFKEIQRDALEAQFELFLVAMYCARGFIPSQDASRWIEYARMCYRQDAQFHKLCDDYFHAMTDAKVIEPSSDLAFYKIRMGIPFCPSCESYHAGPCLAGGRNILKG